MNGAAGEEGHRYVHVSSPGLRLCLAARSVYLSLVMLSQGNYAWQQNPAKAVRTPRSWCRPRYRCSNKLCGNDDASAVCLDVDAGRTRKSRLYISCCLTRPATASTVHAFDQQSEVWETTKLGLSASNPWGQTLESHPLCGVCTWEQQGELP